MIAWQTPPQKSEGNMNNQEQSSKVGEDIGTVTLEEGNESRDISQDKTM